MASMQYPPINMPRQHLEMHTCCFKYRSTCCVNNTNSRNTNLLSLVSVFPARLDLEIWRESRGGGGGPGGPHPPFGPRCRLFNIGPKVGSPLGPPPPLRVDLRWTPPPFKNPGSAPGYSSPAIMMHGTVRHGYQHTFHPKPLHTAP